MYKLVVSDMDDTFLGHGHLVIPSNVRALHRMRELDMLFVPASGRPYFSLMSSLKEIEDALEGSFVISLNGAFVNRVGDPEPIFGSKMDYEAAEDLWSYGFELGICMHAFTVSGGYFVAGASEEEWAWLDGLEGIVDLDPVPSDLSFVGDDPIVKIIYQSEDFEYLHQLGAQMAESLLDSDKVSVTYSSNRYIEFMPAGVSKGVGLKKLADYLGIDVSEVVAVGDAANDASMVCAAGLGVGVANASLDLVPYCDVVLKTNAYDGAFTELVENYLEPAIRE